MDMAARIAGKKALWVSLLALLMIVMAMAAWGCDRTEPVETQNQEGPGGDEVTAEEKPATFTLYFRYDEGAQGWLAPEERTVSGVSDPYRSAMQELIAGPSSGSQLYAVLPNTVKVLDVEVENGICTVNVSKEILTDANQVGVSASGEELALSAIANTLTEFEGVNRVKLLVEGMQSGMLEGRFVEDFWGHLGLPEYLERNEELIYKPVL
jgi:germination protein M